MWFMYILSWIASIFQFFFLLIGVSAGLYYLAELVEEYTVVSKKIITWLTVGDIFVYFGLGLFEQFSMTVIFFGVLSQITHLVILKDFPFASFTSVQFILGVILFFINHYVTFTFFLASEYTFGEVVAFFTVCIWMVPFALFISLSANDNVLPTISENNDALSSILSKKKSGYGLLTFFNNLHERILPRYKKMF